MRSGDTKIANPSCSLQGARPRLICYRPPFFVSIYFRSDQDKGNTDLYVFPIKSYESLNVQNRMCEPCTFSQIWSQIILYTRKVWCAKSLEIQL